MEHSCEAYWTKAEGLARDAICTMGLGAKRLTDAAKRQLEIADLRAGVNVGLRELGELLYATHTGTPTDSELLLEKMREIDELKARLRELEGEPIIYLICRGITSFKDAMACAVKGFNAMVPAILILTFAVSLKNMTGLLGAATYVEGVMKAASAGLFSMLPAIIFIVACLLAFATGTSWGTFGILIPIVLPIFKVGDPLLMIGISACLAGAVCGDHCSPISDTTIMASAGANCNHIEHVQTQLPYAVTVALISFVNFIIAGFVKNAWICLPIGVVMTIVVLFILRATVGKRTSVAAEK